MPSQGGAKTVPIDEDNDTTKAIIAGSRHRRHSLAVRRSSLADTVSRDIIEARLYVRNMLDSMKKERNYMFSETSDAVRRMDMCMVMLLLFTATVTPFEVCFLQANSYDLLFVVNRLVDLGFLVDMCLQFFTIYRNEQGEQVHDRLLIAKRYLKGWFFIDLLAVAPIPFEFLSASPSSSFKSGANLKILRFFRMMRIVKLARIFRASRLMARWESQFGINYSVLGLLKYLAMLTMLTHWGSCFW
jgi:potassium voltage-gated channel Eag-related subfamily H protein 7